MHTKNTKFKQQSKVIELHGLFVRGVSLVVVSNKIVWSSNLKINRPIFRNTEQPDSKLYRHRRKSLFLNGLS